MADQQINYGQISEMLEVTSKGKGIKGFAKKLCYAVIILITLVGTFGSFTFVPLDMDAFVKFIPVLGFFIIPLIVSIGANSITNKIKEKEVEKEQIKLDAIVHTTSSKESVG